MTDSLCIASGNLNAEIALKGGELIALSTASGHDLQWSGDPAVWKGRAPILFPIVGALAGGRYRLDGQSYALPRHGFARDRLFSAVEVTPSRVLLRLTADEETLKLYPFRFDLDLDFALTGATLAITATIRNREPARALPASFGFHPAFAWPLPFGAPRAGHAITFEKEELPWVRRLAGDGTLLPQSFPSPVLGRTLALRDDLFTDDALIFDAVRSRHVVYGAPDGPRIEVGLGDAPQLGLWSRPGANFICIEPWHGHADPQNYTGDLRAKPGLFSLPAGGSKACVMTIRFCT
jgi:galactose mutarotase-like enzyme